MKILGMILNFFGGGVISQIGEQINEARRIRARAENSAERVEADKQIAYLKGRRDVLIAEQGSWMTRWIRPAFALPFVIYNFKIVVWDKVFGYGTTDGLPAEFWHLQMIVFGAYFLTRPSEKR